MDEHAVKLVAAPRALIGTPGPQGMQLPALARQVTMVRLSAEPIQCKCVLQAARAALSDFRRTHEPAALAEAREALGPERWEAVVEFEGGREGGFA